MLKVMKYLLQPILLIFMMFFAFQSFKLIPSSLIFLVIILSTTLILYYLECIIPYEKSWTMKSKDFKESSIYFLINSLADSIGTIAISSLAMFLTPSDLNFPLWPSVFVAVLISEFMAYWFHRLMHWKGVFWKIHSIHHTPKKLHTWNNNKLHPLNVLILNFFKNLPLVIIGIESQAIFLATSFSLIQNYISHTNADIRSGFLKFIIGTPELHRAHHSVNSNEALNYSSVIPLWDLIFNTFNYNSNIKEIGVKDRKRYPKGLTSELVFPFRRSTYY